MVSGRPQRRRWLPRNGGSRALSFSPGNVFLELILVSPSAPSPHHEAGLLAVIVSPRSWCARHGGPINKRNAPQPGRSRGAEE